MMDWTDLQILIPTEYIEEAVAIAQMAAPGGIQIEDYSDMLQLVPKIAHIDLIDEELLARNREQSILHIYLPPEESPAQTLSYLSQRLTVVGIPHILDTQKVKEEEWATAWKQYYHPTSLGNRLVVCPSWEEYTSKPGEVVLRLDPGMAFGTGTHHTTRLCCGLLEEVLHPGDSLLDMGTGSGILAIAALGLGASRAVGVDVDAVAVRIATDNAAQNGYVPPIFTALTGDLLNDKDLQEQVGNGYDLLTANIVADVIIPLASVFVQCLKTGGRAVISGIILSRKEEVLAVLVGAGLQIDRVEEEDGWCAILATA